MARLTVNAGSELAGMPIRQFGQDLRAFVLAHVREGESTFYPSGDTVLQAGDRVTVQTESGALKNIHRLNHDPEPY